MKIFLFLILGIYLFAGFPEYYYQIKSTKKQKQEFIKILYPMIIDENNKILKERKKIINILSNENFAENNESVAFMQKMAKKYKIDSIFNRKEFLKRVDIIPISLVLAQAAVESAWGKSRFCREANNIFGHWTYGKKGLIPSKRDKGKKHKIRIFDSLQDSLSAYMLNLNTNYHYESFRQLRFNRRKSHQFFDGFMAASTLIKYSQLGKKYTKILQNIIKYNKLYKYDRMNNENIIFSK